MLKILKLRKQKKEKEAALATLREKIKGLTTREEELKQALEEAKTQKIWMRSMKNLPTSKKRMQTVLMHRPKNLKAKLLT